MIQLTFTDYFNRDKTRYVRRISYEETKPFLLKIHYARRMPCITDAFGLFVGGQLIGVVTYGIPPSNSLCCGLAGQDNAKRVLELNRLVLLPGYHRDNNASYLVSKSLKMLPNKTFVVSYADTAWTHVGYIYQATNFLYTGMSAKRTDVYQASGSHSRHIDEGSDYSIHQTRSAKHRYVYLVGDKRTKREMLNELRYPIITPYPKGEERRYDEDNPIIAEPVRVYERGDAEYDP